MSKSNEALKRLKSGVDTGKYARLAERYCINRLGGVEGNETLMAALMLCMAIRETSDDLCSALVGVSEQIDRTQYNLSFGGIESAIEELVKAVDNVADHI